MQRYEIVQPSINLFEKASYLEIGVNQGATFQVLQCDRKVAVDPRFLFDVDSYCKTRPNSSYYETTSDIFFKSHVSQHGPFHVIFLDGLHTFEQTLRDLLNSVHFLAKGGVIIIDDVWPVSYSASLRNEQDASLVKSLVPNERDGAWMGDVYRLVFFVETFMPLYSYAAVGDNSNHQLVIWRKQRDDTDGDDRTVEAIARLEFMDVLKLQQTFRPKPLADIVAMVRLLGESPRP